MAIYKVSGQGISAQISFQYQGPGGLYWYGFGLAPSPRTNLLYWYTNSATLPNASTWQTFTGSVNGIIPYDAPYNVYYDSKVVIFLPDGTIVLERWDDMVYYLEPEA